MVERQPNQPVPSPEPTQPLQGRATGRESLQGPTTVDGSEQPQPSPGLPITPQEHPTLLPAHEGRQSTSVQASVFENCIVGDLMPSSERVDEMLAAGRITEEQAAHKKKEALAFERVIQLGERISGIRGRILTDRGLSTIDKRRLRAEYKSLRKEDRRLRKYLGEVDDNL
jgi:hypothetical protein